MKTEYLESVLSDHKWHGNLKKHGSASSLKYHLAILRNKGYVIDLRRESTNRSPFLYRMRRKGCKERLERYYLYIRNKYNLRPCGVVIDNCQGYGCYHKKKCGAVKDKTRRDPLQQITHGSSESMNVEYGI